MKIGLDLGTCNTVVFLPKKGIVLEEPSVVAVSFPENKVIAVGQKAKEMLGKTPGQIKVYRPLREGVIADYLVTQAMIRYFISRVLGKFSFLKPDLLISVPAGITSTEKRAVIEAGLSAGAKNVFLAKEPILAALGAELDISSCSGNFVCDIGGGTTEIAVISLGGIVTFTSIRIAGDKMDEKIIRYIKEKYNLLIGDQTAERIKIEIGTVFPEKEEKVIEIKGNDLVFGLPKKIKISSNEVSIPLLDVANEIIDGIKKVLRETPPELTADIAEKGLLLTGGGSLLRNLPKLISKVLQIPVKVAEDPIHAVARGTGVMLENLDFYKKVLMEK